MEQKRQKALDMADRMKLQASENIQMGSELYIMHATCAVEFADLLMELLTTEATSAPKAAPSQDAPIRVTVECDGKTKVYETIMMFLSTIDPKNKNLTAQFCSRNAREQDAFKMYMSLQKSCEVLDEDGLFKEIAKIADQENLYDIEKIDLMAQSAKEPADHD